MDGTRYKSFESVLQLKKEVEELLNTIPFVLLINKCDLIEQWEISTEEIENMKVKGWPCFISSAKTGENIEQAFMILAQNLVKP